MYISWQNYTVTLKSSLSDGWYYRTPLYLGNKCTTRCKVYFRDRSIRVIRQEEADSQCFSHHQTCTLFSVSLIVLFLLASACLFCWMLWNTDVSLKYWIHPSLGCELCLLLKEQERERGEMRWDPWINCYQFISFTGQIRSMQCRLKLNFSSCEAS